MQYNPRLSIDMEPESGMPMDSLGGIDSEPTPPPVRKNSMPAGVVVPQLPRNISQGVGRYEWNMFMM